MTEKPPLNRTDSDKDSGIGDPLTLSGFRSLCAQDSLNEGDTEQLIMLREGQTQCDSPSSGRKPVTASGKTGNKDGDASDAEDDDAIGTLSEEDAVEYEETHPWKKVTINICGTIIQTYYQVIDRFPRTLLGDPTRRRRYWDTERKEFYFDTHAGSFEGIFDWYQTSVLKKPLFVPMETFLEQLEFFDVDQDAQLEFKKSEGFLAAEVPVKPEGKYARLLWDIFEYPNSSIIARIVGVVSVLFIVVSTTVFCVETLPSQRGKDCLNITTFDEDGEHVRKVPNFSNEYFLIETACVVWFTLEYITRLVVCPEKKVFLKKLLNVVDLLTVLPYFIFLAAMLILQDCELGKIQSVLPLLRILRAFRMFKLTRHSRSLLILCLTLKSSLSELGVSLLFLLFGATFSSFMIYLAEEGEPNSQIDSVAEGIWWAVATMTTVGYGDIVPVGPWGKLVGAACVILGALVLALPAPIIVTNFNRYYQNNRFC